MFYVQMFWDQKSLGLGLIVNKINNEKLAMQKKIICILMKLHLS
jgi:hypothetical protein